MFHDRKAMFAASLDNLPSTIQLALDRQAVCPVAVLADLGDDLGKSLAAKLSGDSAIDDFIARANVGDDLVFTHALPKSLAIDFLNASNMHNLSDKLSSDPPQGSYWVLVVGNNGASLASFEMPI